MSADTRRDPGEFYPGGRRIITTPVGDGGGDVKHSDFADVTVETNTIPKMRLAIETLAQKLGATVAAIAIAVASIGAGFDSVPVNEIDFDENPSVVTNVTFEGLITEHQPLTNYYSKTETDARIVELAPAPGNYSVVSNKAMNAVQSEWVTQAEDGYRMGLGDGGLLIDRVDCDEVMFGATYGPDSVVIGNSMKLGLDATGDLHGMWIGDDPLDEPRNTTLYENGMITRWDASGSLHEISIPTNQSQGTLALTSDITVKSVKRNDTTLTPDASGAVDISVPTNLNDVCTYTENWLGVPGTTAAGKSIKVLAKTVNGVIEGGMTVTDSSNNDNNTTKYRYDGVTATRSGTATDYLFDTSSQSGIVRRSELASKANAADVATISAMLNAENARFVSTNYNSATQIPSAYVQAKIDGSWLEIWNELTRWNWLTDTYLPANFYTKGQINSALDDKADRAWGFYDSHTGLYAPEDYTWISSPKIAIAGGLAYSRTVTAEGAVWVLESNGMVSETGGVVSNGFFRVSDDDGNALFEIVKGDKRTVGATANSVQVIAGFTPTKLQIGYAVQSETHPTLQIASTLANPDWYAEDSSSCPANVTWSGVSGAYVATVQAKSASATQLFVKAEYQVGGETYIKNVGPVSVQGGIYCTDGIHKVRPVYNNGNIIWEVVQ